MNCNHDVMYKNIMFSLVGNSKGNKGYILAILPNFVWIFASKLLF